jgi:Putative addiction module component
MTLTKEQIKSAAMQLDAAERGALAEELLLSIDGGEREAMDAAWLAEVKRRDEDFVAGKSGAKPAMDVIDRIMGRPGR